MHQQQSENAAAALSASSLSAAAALVGSSSSSSSKAEGAAAVAAEFQGQLKVLQQAGDIPPPRFGHTSTYVGNHRIVVFGGAVGAAGGYSITNESFLFDSSSNKWQKIFADNAPPPRAAHAACCVDALQLVVFGGATGGGSLSAEELYLLDLRKDPQLQWMPVPLQGMTPGRRYGHTMVYNKPNIIIFGGNDGERTLADVWFMDVEKSPFRWEEVVFDSTAKRPLSRVYHATEVCREGPASGMVVVFGGRNANSRSLNDTWGLRQHRDGRWDWIAAPTKKQLLPDPRFQHSMVFIGSKMIIVGGRTDNDCTKPLRTAVYDTETVEWRFLTSVGRFRHSSWTVRNTVFTFGGFTHFTQQHPTAELAVLDCTNIPSFYSEREREELRRKKALQYEQQISVVVKNALAATPTAAAVVSTPLNTTTSSSSPPPPPPPGGSITSSPYPLATTTTTIPTTTTQQQQQQPQHQQQQLQQQQAHFHHQGDSASVVGGGSINARSPAQVLGPTAVVATTKQQSSQHAVLPMSQQQQLPSPPLLPSQQQQMAMQQSILWRPQQPHPPWLLMGGNSGNSGNSNSGSSGGAGSSGPWGPTAAGVLSQSRPPPFTDIKLASHVTVVQELGEDFSSLVRRISIDRLEEEGKKINKQASRLLCRPLSAAESRKELLVERILKLLLRPLITQQEVYAAFNTDAPFSIPWNDVSFLCDAVLELVKEDDMVLQLRAPIKVYGDIHGQYYDLMRFFHLYKMPVEEERSHEFATLTTSSNITASAGSGASTNTASSNGNAAASAAIAAPAAVGDIDTNDYLFLGDYVDRGLNSLETICLLFALKVKYPRQIHLLRGNHEDSCINSLYGFLEECKRRLLEDPFAAQSCWNKFNEVFEHLPVAAVIDNSILCLHGGIGKSIASVNDLTALQRPLKVAQIPKNLYEQKITDLLWSDPTDNDSILGVVRNDVRDPDGSGHIYKFGPDRVHRFLAENHLQLIIRAHECVMDGFERFAGGKLITLFSATNYCNHHQNAGALLFIRRDMTIIPKLIYPANAPIQYNSWDARMAELRPPTPPRAAPRMREQEFVADEAL